MSTQGTARGADDSELHAAVAKAIRAALSGLGHGAQSEVARRTGITQPEISKLARGARPTPLTIWEMRAIESATGRPPGYLLQEIGYLPRERSARDAIMGSPDLDEEARRIVLATYDAAVLAAGRLTANPPLAKERRRGREKVSA